MSFAKTFQQIQTKDKISLSYCKSRHIKNIVYACLEYQPIFSLNNNYKFLFLSMLCETTNITTSTVCIVHVFVAAI